MSDSSEETDSEDIFHDAADDQASTEDREFPCSSCDHKTAGEKAEENPEGDPLQDIEKELEALELTLSPEEKEARLSQSLTLKEKGNQYFRDELLSDALECYSAALRLCPTCHPRERAVLFNNRAASLTKMERLDAAVTDCSRALVLHPGYVKPLLRRAQLLEKQAKLNEALEDYKKVLELAPAEESALRAQAELPGRIAEQNERLKEEMMGKLRDLGDLVLRPFGLSTNNFQVCQDPASGSYSVNFKKS